MNQKLKGTHYETKNIGHGRFAAGRRAKAGPGDEWRVGLFLESYGNSAASLRPGAGHLQVEKARALRSDGGVTFEYFNSPEGMRQNFRILARPVPAGGRLILTIRADLTDARMSVNRAESMVTFSNSTGEVMRYSDLNVFDANGTRLPAEFVWLDETHFLIAVDDSKAVYPILVDPLSHYFGASGNQASCLFGYSVAYGKFRGAIGDIAIGAPYYDNGQTDEGKVFVFHGNQEAMDTTADWTAESNSTTNHFGLRHCYEISVASFQRWYKRDGCATTRRLSNASRC